MSSTPKSNFTYFIIALIAAFFGVILGATYEQNRSINSNSAFPSFAFNSSQKLDKILKVIKTNYVDSVNTDSLQSLAIEEILSGLDPHTIYLPPVQAKSQNENLEGNFEGIGIEYYVLNDTLLVTSVRENGPSEKAGLLKGDRIIAVNGENMVVKSDRDFIVNKLRGKKGSKLNVSVLRFGFNKPISLDIERGRIVVSSVDVAYLIKPEIGFIKITRFGANTAEDFSNELNALQKKGMKSLILDLRGNGGGYLSAATALADQFLGDNQLIVYTQGLHEPRTDYKSTSDGMFEKGRLIILIDEGTASASEILAGAIQDLDRGLVIGRRSFGKGLVQEQFGFGDGSAMNLTIARYYTPSGRSIQKSYSKGIKAYKDELNQRYEHGDYSSLDSALKDSIFLSQQKKFKTLKGRTVYGGGGIMPDIFVALDTSKFTDTYQQINASGLVSQYVYGKLTNSVNTSRFKTIDGFKNGYRFTDADYNGFLNYCSVKKVKVDKAQALVSKPLIVSQIKSILARYYFGEEGFYSIYTQNDDFVNTALTKL
ncbi:S41 family peptidase [Pedobacter arcticus]|uniref:S41 family peptidase n=1 Tax=Pedobacter arcticus TaxID=752140 RepID=UPI0002E2D8B0|nr:S41 family peptidase [Pedobacter arcticus]